MAAWFTPSTVAAALPVVASVMTMMMMLLVVVVVSKDDDHPLAEIVGFRHRAAETLLNNWGGKRQFTTGGNSEAEIATPINGPADPWSSATATPLPDVSAHRMPIHRERALPLG
uniref:Uncharacterized protein n=1 Tax=Anopheles coluzzii TaxID=1518534 RepID=A0A8W7P6R9_ANOCL